MFYAAFVALIVVADASANAQTLSGTVRTRDDLRPATGAMVILTDSANRPVAGDVADSLGRFRIVAARSGRYSALRVGGFWSGSSTGCG